MNNIYIYYYKYEKYTSLNIRNQIVLNSPMITSKIFFFLILKHKEIWFVSSE